MSSPLVSVCIITYNQQGFIKECIEGALFQNTTFNIEILLNDDNSNDGTSDVCQKFSNENPLKIRYYKNERNLGIIGNWKAALERCKGKYIALCEGDDYWTDPNKLQKQVDFLEGNHNYSLCFHNSVVRNERIEPIQESLLIDHLDKTTFGTEDILRQWFIPTASILFRREGLIIPEWFYNIVSADIALLLLLSLLGKLKYIDESMSVYRLHPAGVSLHYTSYKKAISMIFLYQTFNIHTNYKYNENINEAIKYELHVHVIDNLLKEKEIEVLNSLRRNEKLRPYILRRLKNLKNKIKIRYNQLALSSK